jgi:dienelactone hydrolase
VRLWVGPPESRKGVLVVHPDGGAGASAREGSLVEPLRRHGYVVASVDAFNSGSARVRRDPSDRFFTTYNRTDDGNRVQDVLTALAWLKKQPGVRTVSLVGLDRAGLWCLLAQALAPGLDAVVADADAFATERDESYLDHVFVPLLRSVGGFETALTLGLGSRIRLHGMAGVFDTTAVEASARATGHAERLRVSRERLEDADVVAWLTAH